MNTFQEDDPSHGEDYSGTLEDFLRRKLNLPVGENAGAPTVKMTFGPFKKEQAPSEENIIDLVASYYAAQPEAYQVIKRTKLGIILLGNDRQLLSITLTTVSQKPGEVTIFVSVV